MPNLVIEQPGVAPRSVELTKAVTTLGRADDNDVILVADEVSRHHAKVLVTGGNILLQDLHSLNGTYVNRQQVSERVLAHNDEIWFGSKCRIHLLVPGAPHQEEAEGAGESSLTHNLARIREDMDRLGSSMTMMLKQRSPEGTPVRADASRLQLVAVGRAYRRLEMLYKASMQVSKLIASNADLPTRLASVLDMAMTALEAERGFVMLRDDESDNLNVHVAREMGQDLKASSPSMGIAQKAASLGEPVLMRDRGQDQQFGARESIIVQRIQSAMCVPLQVEDRMLGSIYVDTRIPGHSFSEEDLELFASIASQSALAIENVRLYAQMVEAEKKRASLGRFLSPSIVDEIMKEDTKLELGGHKKIVTTMFCDIRGFTPIAERIPPSELVAMLNEHFTAMVGILFSLKGTLDKYIGDEIMAVFGAPIGQPDDAIRAVRAAVMMQRMNTALNVERARQDRPQFDIGIGLCTGEAIAGYIGAPERMEFTVVGDRVNTARRLCSIAEPGQVIVSDDTYSMVAGHFTARPIGEVMLKGKELPVTAYEILDVKGGA